MIISPHGAFLRIIVDLDSCRLVSSRAAPVRCRFKALDVEGLRLTQPPLQRRFVVKVLREASNEGTLRAFRNAHRFPTLKIFRRPVALRRCLAPGQSRRSDRFREALNMFVLIRAVTYAALFIGFVLEQYPLGLSVLAGASHVRV